MLNCENPSYVLDPRFVENLLRFDTYFRSVDGSMRLMQISPESRGFVLSGDSPYKVFSLPKVDADTVHDYGFIDTVTGECQYFFLEVPCGRCVQCRHSYVAGLSQRAVFHACQHPSTSGYMITLTYKEEYNPIDVDKRAVQLFKKRFMMTAKRAFPVLDFSSVRWICKSEYGHENRRPHYHLCVVGLPFFSPIAYMQKATINLLCRYCWRLPSRTSFKQFCEKFPLYYKLPKDYDPESYGNINCELLDNVKKSVSYIMKYMFKDADDVAIDTAIDPLTHKEYSFRSKRRSDGLLRNFLTVSRDMGLEFVSRHLSSINNRGQIEYIVPSSPQTVNKAFLSSYYIRKFFPSINSLVPSEVRRSFFTLLFCREASAFACVPHWIRTKVAHQYDLVSRQYDFVGAVQHVIVPRFDKSLFCDLSLFMSLADDSFAILQRFYKSLDVSDVVRKIQSRNRFFSKFRVLSDGSSYRVHVREEAVDLSLKGYL